MPKKNRDVVFTKASWERFLADCVGMISSYCELGDYDYYTDSEDPPSGLTETELGVQNILITVMKAYTAKEAIYQESDLREAVKSHGGR